MTAKELITILEKLPQDLPIRLINTEVDDQENIWLYDVNFNNTGDSGYELCGEIRFLGTE